MTSDWMFQDKLSWPKALCMSAVTTKVLLGHARKTYRLFVYRSERNGMAPFSKLKYKRWFWMICFEAKWPKAFICQKQQPRKTYRLQKKFWTLGRIGAMLLYIIIWSVDDPYFFFAFGMETQNGRQMHKGLT